MRTLLPVLLFSSFSFAQTAPASSEARQWEPVAKIIGKAGTLQNGIYKIGLPRTDLNVHIGATKVEPSAGLGSWMAFAFALIYFMSIRPQAKKQKELATRISSLKTGDRVVTTGGIYGTVANVKDGSTLLLKIADNVKIEIDKSAIANVVNADNSKVEASATLVKA